MKEVFVRRDERQSEILERLKLACVWAEISQGRAMKYQSLFEDIIKGKTNSLEHILVYSELEDLIEIHKFWVKTHHWFPGIKEKVREIFTNGPVLREYELTESSGNRPRNDSFVIYLAGSLMESEIDVVGVEGIRKADEHSFVGIEYDRFYSSDIFVHHLGLPIRIECKRPQSIDAIRRRTKSAKRQIKGDNGIIAIDCSAALRPPAKFLDAPSDKKAGEFLHSLISDNVETLVRGQFSSNILGAIFHIRAPVHTIQKVSQILDLRGNPIIIYGPNSLSTLYFLGNSASPNVGVFRSLKDVYIDNLKKNHTGSD